MDDNRHIYPILIETHVICKIHKSLFNDSFNINKTMQYIGFKGTLAITEEGVKICFSEISKVNIFSRPLLEQNCIHRSILIENISFKGDIKKDPIP